jgi:ABC-2 type transport system ATP-binding protein
MLTGYISPSGGKAFVAGYDIAAQPTVARRHIGVVPEEANVYADLTVWQNIMLMAELHGVGKSKRVARGEELLQTFDLGMRARQKGRELSKGLRQRLMLCMALVSDPEILFLDEPTSGLDVASARLIREVIMKLNRERGMTVFITTHNMDEADQLCHRVAIIDHGTLAAIDTPVALRGRVDSRRSVAVRFREPAVRPEDMLLPASAEVVMVTDGFRVFGPDPGMLAQEIVTRANTLGLHIERIDTLAPTLEEVFVSITGGIHGN